PGGSGGGGEGDDTVVDAGLDVVVVGGEVACHAHGAGVLQPVHGRARRADAAAAQVVERVHREGGHQSVVVEREAGTEVGEVEVFPGLDQLGDVVVHAVHDLGHDERIGGAERQVVGDVLQRQVGRFEHRGHDPDVGQAGFERFEFAADG